MVKILFKGKRADNGEWVEGGLVQGDGYCIIVKYDTATEELEGYDVVLETVEILRRFRWEK